MILSKRRKTLVVGGKGFIGSHLMSMIEADVIDLKDGNDVIDGISERYDVIVFLAVDMGRTAEAYYYNSMLYDVLDDYMQEYPSTHVIYTSSAAVYPDELLVQTEKSLVAPVNLYGKAKLLGECYVQQYKRHTILRLANVYGDGGSGAYNLFVSGHKTIYGDGKDVRDYIPVDLVCRVIKYAISHPKLFQGITNVSSGQGTTTNSLFAQFGHGRPKHIKARRGDVHYSVLDNSKLNRILHLL